MVGLLLKVGLWLLGLCGFGKPDPQKTGSELQKGADAQEVLDEIKDQHNHASDPVPDSVRKLTYRD